ncbi:MAG: hypothetical protein PVI06_13800 [Desulfobacterales bacterium]
MGFYCFPNLLSLDRLRQLGDVSVVEERIVKDGTIWTAAGVSAGIDLALEFIKHEANEAVAGKIHSYSEYYPSGKRYGNFHLEPEAPEYLSQKA